MNANLTRNHYLTPPSLSHSPLPIVSDGRVKVALIIGGAFQEISRWPDITGCHLHLYADVPAEVKAVNPGSGVIRLTLAEGHTIGTLTEKDCPAALRDFLRNRPGVSLSVGLAQMRAIGKLAAKALLSDPTFERFIHDQILDPLRIITNGCLVQVDLVVFASGAGGTGGPVAAVLAKAIADVILQRSDAIVREHFVRIGSMTYVSLGDRVFTNEAATLSGDLHWILAQPRHQREVRSLALLELPMVRGDKEARAVYGTQVVQALSCRQVQEQLDLVGPNRALETEFGTVTVFNADYWHSIGPRRIAEDASEDYVPQLESVRRTPGRPGRVTQIRPVPTFGKSGARNIEDLMGEIRLSRGVRPRNLVEQCLAATEDFTGGNVSVTLERAESFDLGANMLAQLRLPVRTVSDWRNRLEILRTTITGLAEATDERQPALLKLEGKCQRARNELQKALGSQYPRGAWQSFWAFFANPQRKLVRIHNAIARCREATLEHLRLTGEVELLTRATGQLQEILDDEIRRIDSLLNLLRPFLRPATANAHRLTENVELDNVLPKLLASLDHRVPPDGLLKILAGCVRRVTIAGLAVIVQATENQLDSVAQRLVEGVAPVPSPRWGGKRAMTASQEIIVLPPVEEHVLSAIKARFKLSESPAIIASADTAQAGANIVRLEVNHPRDLHEVMTKVYAAALADANETPEQHATTEDLSLKWMTDQINSRNGIVSIPAKA